MTIVAAFKRVPTPAAPPAYGRDRLTGAFLIYLRDHSHYLPGATLAVEYQSLRPTTTTASVCLLDPKRGLGGIGFTRPTRSSIFLSNHESPNCAHTAEE